MPKKIPHQGGQPIRGGNTPTLSQNGFNGNIPPAAIQALEQEAAGVMHGVVTLTFHIKDGHLIRYATGRDRSFVPGKPTTGSCA